MKAENIGAMVPPHAMEAEQGLIGAVMLDPAAWEAVAHRVSPDHFFSVQHRAVWLTLEQQVRAGRALDVVSVMEAGGHDLAYLNACAMSVPSSAHCRSHAALVVERWREREVMRIGLALADAARRGQMPEGGLRELIGGAVDELFTLDQDETDRDPKPAAQVALDYVEFVSALNEGKVPVLSTGLRDLDDMTGGGMWDGELWVIGARPSMGKTAFTNHIARAAGLKAHALFLTQEDSLVNLAARNVAALGRVNLADLRNPRKAPQAMWEGLTAGAEALATLNLWMDDQASLKVSDVRRKVQQVKRRMGKGQRLGLVVVDYLQLMQGDGANRNIQLGEVANGLKRLAKEEGGTVVLLSQMNRECERRAGPPVMSDLRDSGDIEGAADVIGLLHREAQRNADADKRHAELHLVKNKTGQTGVVNLDFDGAFQRFGNWEGPRPVRMKSRSAAHDGFN
jgi:replicative DNA helicase